MADLLLNLVVVVSSLVLLFVSRQMATFVRELGNLSDIPLAPREDWPLVSVIVPACNEAGTIKDALTSLRALDYPALELILLNDRSTDETGAIMDEVARQDARVRVCHISQLPQGWLGKPHALHRGTLEARGTFLLFTDADVVFAPDTLRRAMSAMARDDLAMLTLIPELKAKGMGLKLALAYFFHYATITASPKKIRDPNESQSAGMGAFNLVRTDAFRRTSGFEWLKGEVVEDMATGYMMKQHGGKVAMLSGLGQISLEWYPTLGALVRGLEKNYFALLEYSMPLLCAYLVALYAPWIGAAVLMPFASPWVVAFSLTAWMIYVLTTMRVMARVRHPWWTALFFPISMPLFPLILVRSALLCKKRGGIVWRGTFYEIDFLRRQQRFKLRDFYKRRVGMFER